MKISFDFDSTLTKPKVQGFARKLIKDGHEIWVHTTRSAEEDQPFWIVNGIKTKRGNDDLFKIIDKLGIPRERIVFTNHEWKDDFVNGKGFLMHLDDDWIEIRNINEETNTKGITCFGDENRKRKMIKLLE